MLSLLGFFVGAAVGAICGHAIGLPDGAQFGLAVVFGVGLAAMPASLRRHHV
jgi:hypothetical protein